MPSHDPAERSAIARIAAHSLHGSRDSREVTAPARAAFHLRFEREVDPDGVLDPDERRRRAGHAMQAYMLKLARKSAAARRAS